jgi:hypothetical protein
LSTTKAAVKHMATAMASSLATSAASATAKTLLGSDNYKLLSGAMNNVITDPFEFLKKSWAGLSGIPKTITPTFDIEELDKRITDMKAVEGWLQMNLSMLQGSIKSMEIQRGTLMTIKDLGQSLTPQTATGLAKDLAGGIKDAANAQTAAAWWDLLQQQFSQVTQAAAATLKPAAVKSTSKSTKTSKQSVTKTKPAKTTKPKANLGNKPSPRGAAKKAAL